MDHIVIEGFMGTGKGAAAKKLAKENFSNLSPSPILVALEYSHPTLSQRIEAIEAFSGEAASRTIRG